MNTYQEKRKKQRFSVADGAFAAFHHSPQRGQILNISTGGLSFKYIANNESIENKSEIVIYLAGRGLCCNRLPVEIVNNIEIPKENSFSSIRIRQVCLKFKPMSKKHRLQLDRFLQTYCTGKI